MTTTTETNEPTRASALGRLFIALADIKLAHSVFALPFAVLAAFLVAPRESQRAMLSLIPQGPAVDPAASDSIPIAWGPFGVMLTLVVVCMVFARTWAMIVNRVADRHIDAANPRTARRAFAAGDSLLRDGVKLLVFSALGFVACCVGFGVLFANWWPALLSLPVLGWIALYSYTKRFTWLCHLFLGGALAASPMAAAIAVGGDLFILDPLPNQGSRISLGEEPTVTPVMFAARGVAVPWLAAMVLFWVAGFDVIYALQDLDFDRDAGLKSVPARFGWRGAAWIARLLHLLALAALGAAWFVEPRFGMIFGIGFGVVALAIIFEHIVLARRGREGIPMAFFTLNGIVSIVLGVAGIADVLV